MLKAVRGRRASPRARSPSASASAAAQVLQDRDAGFRKAFEGTQLRNPRDAGSPDPGADNYGRWENIMAANPDAVAAVGLCSIDIPNLAQIKERTGGTWLIGGYDLDPPTLQAIKDGLGAGDGRPAGVSAGLPAGARARRAPDQRHAAGRGWLETPTEVVTADERRRLRRLARPTIRSSTTTTRSTWPRTYADLEAVGPAIRRPATPGDAAGDPAP